MNQKELFTALHSIGLPVAYGEFQSPAPTPPLLRINLCIQEI